MEGKVVNMNLNEFIKPKMNAARSINLSRDYLEVNLINEYQLTAKGLEILRRFVDALEGEKINAWSLTGPYGMGKSAFANYLLAITGPRNDSITRLALRKLRDIDLELHDRFENGIEKKVQESGFFRIAVTSSFEPVNNTIARAMLETIKSIEIPDITPIKMKLKKIINNTVLEPNVVFLLFKEFKKIINKPILIVIDEFGKNLDYMASNYERGDIFIIQQLVELDDVYMWLCLHQEFEGYAASLSSLQRQEWSKIQGRFEDIPFVETINQMLILAEKAMQQISHVKLEEYIGTWAQNSLDTLEELGNRHVFTLEMIKNLYPLHPITATVLIELCIRYAQNDRTLLAFICSNDLLGLPAFLENTKLDKERQIPAIGLDYLYDYFFNSNLNAYINRTGSQKWVEIHDSIQNVANMSDLDEKILKSIGVLNLIPGVFGLKASPEVLYGVMAQTHGIEREATKNNLRALEERGVILYRDYSNEFRLWEGSDYDVQKAIGECRVRLKLNNLSDVLQNFLPLTPIIASRHSYEKGTIRRFERRWLEEKEIDKELETSSEFDGLILYTFGKKKKLEDLPKTCKNMKPIVIGYASSYTTLKKLALEIAAIRSLLTNSKEIQQDYVARKELRYRLKVSKNIFKTYVERLFMPNSKKITWYVGGRQLTMNNYKEFSSMLSKLFDEYYYACPPIKNEMVSYEKLSNTANRARRILIENMFANFEKENLGIKGFGAEVAIYRSMLQSENFHKQNLLTGKWYFTLDSENKDQYEQLWHQLDLIMNEAKNGITLEEIIEQLKKPPFGLRQGPSPIFIALYLINYSDDIAVFHEGIYKPYLSSAEIALMIRRPDLYSLKKYMFTDLDQKIFTAYRTLLKSVGIMYDSKMRNENLVSVVGPLIQFVEALPQYTLNTMNVSLAAQQLRLAIKNSRDPIKLIFEDIPVIYGIDFGNEKEFVNEDVFREKLYSSLYELSQAFFELEKNAQRVALNILDSTSIENLYRELKERVTPLIPYCNDKELSPLLNVIVKEYSNSEEWAMAFAAFIVRKPLDSWTDNDINIYEMKLASYRDRIDVLEDLVELTRKNKKGQMEYLSVMFPKGEVGRIKIDDNIGDDIKNEVRQIREKYKTKNEIAKVLFLLAQEILGGNSND